MKQKYRQLQQFLGFTRKETNGFLVMSVIMLFAVIILFLLPIFLPNAKSDTTVDKRQLDSLVALLDTTSFDSITQKKDFTNRYKAEILPQSLFNFDPNIISVKEWQQLGVPQFLATRIIKYRNKGGKFKVKGDLKKIYDFPDSLYLKLHPYVQLPETMEKNKIAYTQNSTREFKSSTYSVKKDFVPARFDLNAADTNQLKAIRGIGTALSKRILKYRDALGGFRDLNQVREVYGLDSLVVSELLKFAYLSETNHFKKLKINSATVEEIDAHPYITPRLAKIMVAYRQQHGAYHSTEDLAKIKILDQTTLQKIGPYLSFE